jgi:AcrR family transcriptional regulator
VSNLPRSKEQYEAMRNATRDKIHAAAINLYTHKGFAATSVQNIADRAEISTGLMYRHYKSKEELFGALLLEAADGLKKTTQILQNDVSPVDLMKGFTDEILKDISRDDEFVQYMVLMTQAFMMEGFSQQIHNLMQENSSLIDQTALLIKKGQELGQFKPGDSSEMAIYYFATMQGLAEMKFALKDRFKTPSPKIVTSFLFKEEEYDD